MKKLLFTIGFLLLAYISIGQVTNSRVLRVANNTTDFGENLPKGSYVYDMNAKILYVLDVGAASTEDLTSVGANKTAINSAPSTEVQDETYNSTNFDNDLTHGVSQDDFYDFQHTGDTDDDALVNKVDLSSAGVVTTDASGVLSSVSTVPIANGGTNSGTSLTNGKVMISNAGAIVESATITTTELGLLDGLTSIDPSSTNEIEVTDEAYSAANFNGGTTAGTSQDDFYDFNHTGDTDDDALVDKVDLTSAGFVKTDASGVLSVDNNTYSTLIRITQWVEVAADDLTQPYPVTLAQTPNASTKITVQINGVPIKYQAGTTNGTFNYSGTSLSIYANVYQYDQIEIDYEY